VLGIKANPKKQMEREQLKKEGARLLEPRAEGLGADPSSKAFLGDRPRSSDLPLGRGALGHHYGFFLRLI
jgi:hypothetical protein